MTRREFNEPNTPPETIRCMPFPFFISFIVLCYLFYSQTVFAQWKSVITLSNESIPGVEVIYFLDQIGFPNIGFAADYEGNVFKSTDTGLTWKSIPMIQSSEIDYNAAEYLRDIVFKDSSTGWMTAYVDFTLDPMGGACLKTTDGGETWNPLNLPLNSYGCNSIYYDRKTDGLFFSNWLSGIQLISWDEGATWTTLNCGRQDGYAFNNDDTGVLSGVTTDRMQPATQWLRTTDGGNTWDNIPMDSECWQPLAIPETNTQFAITDFTGIVFRTDDLWNTWTTLFKFPFIPDEYGGSGSTGTIRGSLKQLFVQVRTGCYTSLDSGKSWKYLCGMPTLPFIQDTRFYVNGNRIFLPTVVQTSDTSYTSYLWMLNLDSLNTFSSSSSEQFPNGFKQETISAGDTVRVDYNSDSALGPEIGVDSVSLTISFDTSVLTLARFELDSGWSIKDSSSSGGTYHLLLVDSDSLGLDSSTRLLRADFGSYLTNTLQSKVYLDSVHFYGQRLNCDCAVQSVLTADTSLFAAAIDSVQINFTGCGDSTLLAAMNDSLQFVIQSIVPNPSTGAVQISFINPVPSAISYQVFDAFGQTHLSGVTGENALSLDVSSLPQGIYFFRAANGTGFTASSKLVIVR